MNRRFRQVARRQGLTDSQLDWVANHLCDRDLLCDYLGLSIQGRLMSKSGGRVLIKTGLARTVEQICTCGFYCTRLTGVVSNPVHMRTVEDTSPCLADNHSPEEHQRDLNEHARHDFEYKICTLTKVNVLEVIEPGDPRYHNHQRWVRGIVQGRTLFVRAYGLRNTAY